MNDKRLQGSCEHGSEIVEYIYGEMAAARSMNFESHLAGCSACVEEFAAISESRFDVYEWRKLEFTPLETPAFVIPFVPAASSASNTSWYRRISEAFSLPPGLAAATTGFGSVAVIAGLAFFMMGGGPDLREIVDTEKRIVPSSNLQQAEVMNGRAAVAEIPGTSGESMPKQAKPESSAERSSPVPIRASTAGSRKTPVRRSDESPAQAVKTKTPAKRNTRPLPRLNDFDEDTDDSLRLAQLFEDIETSD